MRAPPPRRTSTRIDDDTRPFWLVSLIQTLAVAVVSYFIAVFVFIILARISELPRGTFWDEAGLRAVILFVLLGVAFGLMLVPYFRKEWDAGTRTLSLFSATFLIAYAVFHATGIVNPDVPMLAFIRYVVDPVRHALGFS